MRRYMLALSVYFCQPFTSQFDIGNVSFVLPQYPLWCVRNTTIKRTHSLIHPPHFHVVVAISRPLHIVLLTASHIWLWLYLHLHLMLRITYLFSKTPRGTPLTIGADFLALACLGMAMSSCSWCVVSPSIWVHPLRFE